MKKLPHWLSIALLVSIGLMGCTAALPSEPTQPVPTITERLMLPELTSTAVSPTIPMVTPVAPERVPPTATRPLVTGEVPVELLDALKSDLIERTGTTLDEITVLQAQVMIWSDGSLGCPQPGVLYTQALVNGYWVVLEVGDQEYDYRLADNGSFFLCRGGLPSIFPQGTPDS
jgi:hypothetical protein